MILMVCVLSVPTEASVGGASSGGTHNGKEAKKAAKKPEQAGPLQGACKSLHNSTKVAEAASGAAKAAGSTKGEGAAAPCAKEAEIYKESRTCARIEHRSKLRVCSSSSGACTRSCW